MTQLLHRLDDDPFQARLQLSRLEQLRALGGGARAISPRTTSGCAATEDF